MAKNRDDFSRSIKVKLAERAGFICSNPSCTRITIGPDFSTEDASITTGIAAHITAASPNGPRYDVSLSPSERSSISNGIWLCGTCSILIDKNKGKDYKADTIRRWKKDHENLIKNCLEGSKRISFNYMTIHSDSNIASNLVSYLEGKGVLFNDYHDEVPNYVLLSIKEIRDYTNLLKSQISRDTPMDTILHSINNACRHYMNTINDKSSNEEFILSLGAFRKILMLNINDISNYYNIKIKDPLLKYLLKP